MLTNVDILSQLLQVNLNKVFVSCHYSIVPVPRLADLLTGNFQNLHYYSNKTYFLVFCEGENRILLGKKMNIFLDRVSSLKVCLQPRLGSQNCKNMLHIKALCYKLFFIKALTKRLWKLTIKTKRLSRLKSLSFLNFSD